MNIHLSLVFFTIIIIALSYIFFGHDKPRIDNRVYESPKVEYKRIMCLTPDNVEMECKG